MGSLTPDVSPPLTHSGTPQPFAVRATICFFLRLKFTTQICSVADLNPTQDRSQRGGGERKEVYWARAGRRRGRRAIRLRDHKHQWRQLWVVTFSSTNGCLSGPESFGWRFGPAACFAGEDAEN